MLTSGHAILAFWVAFCAQWLMTAGRFPGPHRLSMNTYLFEFWNPFGIEVITGLGPGSRSSRRPAMRRNADGAKRKNVFLIWDTLAEISPSGASPLRHSPAFGCPSDMIPECRTHYQERNKRFPIGDAQFMFSLCNIFISIKLVDRRRRMTQKLIAVGHHSLAMGAQPFASHVKFRQPCIRLLRCRMLPEQFTENFDVVAGT
jgi:hypothetical protein